MGTILDHIPWWGQLRDVVPSTGKPDIYATADCGEECVCMVVWHQKRRYLREDQVRLQMPGNEGHGSTLPDQLVAVLRLYGVQAEHAVLSGSAYKGRVKAALDQGLPCILLGWFQGHSELHWVVACGYGNDALVYMDPWDGVLHIIPWAVVDSLATGDVVRVTG